MAELVDVVLDRPVLARLAHEIGPHFGGDDLVDAAGRTVREDRAVEVHDHAFAHGIERAVRAAHADVGRDHQIAEGVRLVGEAPCLADRRRIAGRADHDLRALVGAFARHLGEHAVMADDERELAALRPLDYRDADVARLPRLDRHPRMHLAVIEFQRARIVDDEAGIIRIAAGVELHDGETAPDLVLGAGGFERRDLRPVERAHDRRVRVHRQPVQRVFGKDDEVHGGQIAPCLADELDDTLRLRREVGLRDHVRQLQLHEADDDAVRSLVQSAQSVHG